MTNTYTTSAPEEVNEFKKTLITWAQNQATGYRTQSAIAVRKTVAEHFKNKAESYDFMVKYLQDIEINSISKY